MAEMAPAFGGLFPWLVLLFSYAGLKAESGGRSVLGRNCCCEFPFQALLRTDYDSVCVRSADSKGGSVVGFGPLEQHPD